jgi:hypothetical protein
MRDTLKTIAGLTALLLGGLAQTAVAQTYEVTVTNITAGQTFTPFIASNHTAGIRFFKPGRRASAELAELAESGATDPLKSLLASVPDLAFSTAGSDGLLGPGESVTFTIDTAEGFRRLSLAAMLIPTNDSFVALDSVRLPDNQETFYVPAYDAGSELNDEVCANIPGPVCGGEGTSADDGEGFVHISRGIQGIADLDPAAYDWRNPVARIRVRLMSDDGGEQ